MEKLMRNLLIGVAVLGIATGFAKAAEARDYRITTEETATGWRTTVRAVAPVWGGTYQLSQPAPANGCARPTFEVVNPGRDEARCVRIDR